MVKAMGRHRRGSKSGGVEPGTISLALLAAIAGVAGYGSTLDKLSDSDQAKVEAAVRARLLAEQHKNPRSTAPCPDFKSERNRLLARIAEYESSEIRFRLATPDQIVKVVETVKEKVGVPKKGGADPPSDATATNAVVPDATIVPPAVVQSDATAATIVPPAVVQSDATNDVVQSDATAAPTVEPGATADPALQSDGTAAPAIQPDAVEPAKKPTEPPITAELLPEPDLEKAGVILDSIPKALVRPRLITVLIKLESATRESLETLRKYFDEAFAKLEPGSKTPMRDALKKMRERGKKSAEPITNEPQTDRELPKLAVGPPTTPVVEPVVEPVEPVVEPVVDTVVPPAEPVVDTVVPPVVDTVVPPAEPVVDTVVPPVVDTVVPPVVDTVVPPVVEPVEPVVEPAVETESTRRLSNLGPTLATNKNEFETKGNIQSGIKARVGKLKKSSESKKKTQRGGMRKKKLRTRRGVKQNVRRSSGRKNRSNRTHTNSR